MHGAMGEILPLLRIAPELAARALVPHVGRRDHKAAGLQWCTSIRGPDIERDAAAQAAAADLQEALCPAPGRKIKPEADGWRERALDRADRHAVADRLARLHNPAPRAA